MSDVDVTKTPTQIEIANAITCCGTIGADMIRRLAFALDMSKSQWLEGYIAGITAYAWWKDGEQYVGTCGRTLNEAIAEAREGFETSQ